MDRCMRCHKPCIFAAALSASPILPQVFFYCLACMPPLLIGTVLAQTGFLYSTRKQAILSEIYSGIEAIRYTYAGISGYLISRDLMRSCEQSMIAVKVHVRFT